MKISDTALDVRNANRGTDRGREALRVSLERYGAGRSILLDRHSRVIAGNKTISAAAELGHEDLLVVDSDGSKLVAVRRTDLDLDEPAARELALSDNRVAELDLEWSSEALEAALKDGLDLSAFWTGDELEELLRGLEPEGGLLPGADPDQVPESVEPRAKLGELWQLGRHRLYVGDATNAAEVSALLGNERMRMIWTDPPYGVDYAEKNAYLNETDRGNRLTCEIQSDTLSETAVGDLLHQALTTAVGSVVPGGGVYVASPAGTTLPFFIAAFTGSGFAFKHSLAWVKDQFVLGRCDYHYRHEVILYGWKEGAHYFADDRTQDSVFEVPRPRANDVHPTMKPVELIARMVTNSSRPGDAVYDPFAGSGSTLLACEQLGRAARLMEIDPQYASVLLARYEQATGETARRL
jgi:DNA modification methylase